MRTPSLAAVLFLALGLSDPLSAGDPGIPLTARVVMVRGRPTLLLNGEQVYPMIYALTDVPGGRWTWEELPQHNLRVFSQKGCRLFQVDLFLEQLWEESGRFDITLARRQIAGVQSACPGGAVILRFHVTAPRWWMRSHPEEWVHYADAPYMDEHLWGFPRILEEDNNPVRRVSMASEVWKEEGLARLRQFCAELAATPEGNALAGIQVADGVYGEWHNWGFYRNEPDTGPAMTDHFRGWLRARYGDDRGLRSAWGDGQVSLASVTIPGMEERKSTKGIFRDPSREQKVIDYYRCVHELVADNIVRFARVVKETWPRPILTGAFYGYFFSMFGRQAAGGHLELQRVLSSPFLDYLAGPQAYGPEAGKLGEPYRSRSLIATIRLHGKLWLDEMDNEPTVPLPASPEYDLLLHNSIANVRRNLTFSFTKGMGLWFYDFGVGGVDLDGFRPLGRGSRGTWDHPIVQEEIRSARGVYEQKGEAEYRSGADVLLVYDTESFYYTASLRGSDPVSNVLIDENSLTAFKSGVVFDPIHRRDLETVDLAPYRTVVFGNTYLLTKAERDFIARDVAKGGRTLIWFYAPGYADGAGLDLRRISEVTGISVEATALSKPPLITVDGWADHAVTYQVGEAPLSPLFAVRDSAAEPFGHFVENGEVAIARKRFTDHTSWYIALPNKDVEPLRKILQESGAHVYSNEGDIVYAGSGCVMLHTREGGMHHLTLRNGKSLSFSLHPGAHTLLLDSETGERLLEEP